MRRTGREGIYTRVVNKDLDQMHKEQVMREVRLELLDFEPVTDEQREYNLLCHELYGK